jgi:hypothetical protein
MYKSGLQDVDAKKIVSVYLTFVNRVFQDKTSVPITKIPNNKRKQIACYGGGYVKSPQ